MNGPDPIRQFGCFDFYKLVLVFSAAAAVLSPDWGAGAVPRPLRWGEALLASIVTGILVVAVSCAAHRLVRKERRPPISRIFLVDLLASTAAAIAAAAVARALGA